MNERARRHGVLPILLLVAAVTLAACDASSPANPLPDGDQPMSPTQSSVVVGQIVVRTGSGADDGQNAGAFADPSGVVVTVEGAPGSDTTDDQGAFRIESLADGGQMRLRFQGGTIDAVLELDDVRPGGLVQVAISLTGRSATIESRRSGEHGRFEGRASFVSLSGTAPHRVLRVEVADDHAGTVAVDIFEGETIFRGHDSSVARFGHLVEALEAGTPVGIKGEGRVADDGIIAASMVVVETDHSGGDRDHEDRHEGKFGGLATLVRVTGTEPGRVARIEVTHADRTQTVDLIEGTTAFAPAGDLVRFGEVLSALESNVRVTIRGEGRPQDDGSIAALHAKVEVPDHDGHDGGVAAGLATLESVRGETPDRVMHVVLVNPRHDARIKVAILEGSTAFGEDGAVHTFGRLLEVLHTDARVWIAAEGRRNDEGVLVASKVKVEID